MKLTSLTEDLDKILPHHPPVLEQTLHAMISLCIDIQAHCDNDIEDGVVKNHVDLNNNLAFLSNLLCEIYNANSDGIRKHTGNDFNSDLLAVRKKTREAKQRMLDQEGKLDELKQAQAELQKQLDKEQKTLSEHQEQESRHRKLREDLDRAIERLKGIDLPALELKNTKLESEKAQLEDRKTALANSIARLTGEVEYRRQACCSSDSKCTALTGELEQCRKKLAASEARRLELEKLLADTNGKADAADRRCGELALANTDAEKRLVFLVKNTQEARAKLDKTGEEIASHQTVYDGLLPRLNSSTDTLNDLLKKIEEAQDTINGNDRAINAGRSKLPSLDEKICTQNTELENLGNQITQKNTAVAALNTQITQRESEKTAAEKSLAAVQAEEARLARLVRSARAEEQRLKELGEAHNRVLVSLSGIDCQVKSAEEELAGARDSLSAAESRRDELLKQIAEANKAAQEFDLEACALNPQYASAEQVRLEKQQIRDNIRSRLTAAQEQSAELEKQSGELAARLEQTNSGISEKNAAITGLEADIAQAEQEHSNLLGQVAVLQEDLVHQNSKNEKFREGELKTAQDVLASAEASMKQLIAERDSLKQQRERIVSETDRITGEISRLNLDIMPKKHKLDECAKALADKQKEHSEKERELKELNDQIGTISEKLKKLKDEIQETRDTVNSDDNTALEKMLVSTLAELKDREASLNKMREELPVKAAELDKLRKNHDLVLAQDNHVESEHRRLSEELRQLQDPKTRAKIEQLSGRNETLTEIRSRILKAAEKLKLNTDSACHALELELEYVSSTLEDLRACIRRDTEQLQNSIH